MPRIRCHYEDCVFLEEGYCGAAAVELEPDGGCLTFQRDEEAEPAEEEWDEEDFEDELEEEEDLYEEEEEEDTWDDDDEGERF